MNPSDYVHLRLRCESKEAFETFARNAGYLKTIDDVEDYQFDDTTTTCHLTGSFYDAQPDPENEGGIVYVEKPGFHVDILTRDPAVENSFQSITIQPNEPRIRFAGH